MSFSCQLVVIDLDGTLLARDGRLHVTEHVPRVACTPGTHAPVDVIVVETSAHETPDALPYAIGDADAPVVVLGAPEDEGQVIALAELGVLGFVEREASLDELVASVVNAAQGEASFPTRIATTLLRRVSSGGTRLHSPDVSALTVRERQVVQLIAEGLSNKEIAHKTSIAAGTVRNHLASIFKKLHVRCRSEATAKYLRSRQRGG